MFLILDIMIKIVFASMLFKNFDLYGSPSQTKRPGISPAVDISRRMAPKWPKVTLSVLVV
jgi:hypothetical protein